MNALRRRPWLALVAAAVLLLVAWNAWWVAAHRHGYPLTIDEAGYVGIGMLDNLGLRSGGLHGWWHAIDTQVPQAPLLPALTSVTLIFRYATLNAFAVLIAFMAVLVFAAYGIGARLAGPRLGALAALLVGTLPGTVAFTREYVFTMGVAAFLSCAVYALLRSDGLRSRRWALACGAAIGLMLLSRSMTIAFVPALLVTGAATAYVRGRLRGEGELGRRALNLALTALVAFGLAATWYVRNYKPVYEYLTGYGYGSSSAYYGANHSLLSWGRWRAVAFRMIDVDLLVPLATAIALGLAVLLVVAVRRVRGAPDRRAALVSMAASDAFTVALVIACCYLALTSSRNGGEGFTAPVSALLPPLAVVSLRHLSRRAALGALAFLAIATTLNLLATSNFSEALSKQRLVAVPGFGSLPWTSGVPRAVAGVRLGVPGPETRFDAADHEWEADSSELANYIVKVIGEGAHEAITFASRNTALNTNTLSLDGLATFHRQFFLAQLTAEPDTVANYVEQLESSGTGILITMSSEAGDYEPRVTQVKAEAAARHLGFHVTRTTTLPDGRLMRVWLAPAEPG